MCNLCVIYDIFIWPVVGQSAVFASRMSNARRHPNGRIHVGKYEPLHLAGVYTGSPPPPVTAIRKLMETHAFHQRFDLSIVHNNSLRWLRMRGTSPTIGRDISSVNQRSLGNPAKLSSQMGVAWGLAASAASFKIWHKFWVKHATSCTKQCTKVKSTSGSGAFQSFGVPGPPITQHGNGKKHNLEWENHRWKLSQHANSKGSPSLPFAVVHFLGDEVPHSGNSAGIFCSGNTVMGVQHCPMSMLLTSPPTATT